MNRDLLLALLSMDTYHRGYNPGLDAGGQLGLPNTTSLGGAQYVREVAVQEIGFYARVYTYNGETIIAYRGTDRGFTDLTPDIDL